MLHRIWHGFTARKNAEARGAVCGWRCIPSQGMCDMLHYAFKLADLKSPPGNRLEALEGKLDGCHSIRVNDQWRVVFEWTAQGPSRVRVIDYH